MYEGERGHKDGEERGDTGIGGGGGEGRGGEGRGVEGSGGQFTVQCS